MTSVQFPDLAWGVELEFMADPPVNNCHPDQLVLTRRAVAQKLALETKHLDIAYEGGFDENNVHVSTGCASCKFSPPGECCSPTYMTSGPAEHVNTRPGTLFSSNVFLVQAEELDNRESINKKRDWPAVEISTPIFDRRELLNGMPALSEALSGLRNMRGNITADKSCGLHVHIGVPSGMTLLFAKKMATLVSILEEPLFRKLCTPRRARESAHAAPIYSESCLASLLPVAAESDFPEDIDLNGIDQMNDHLPPFLVDQETLPNNHELELFTKVFERIWTAPSLLHLSKLLRNSNGKRLGMAITIRTDEGGDCSSRNDMPGAESTIEIRYLQMSFDKTLIQKWVEVLFQVANIALLDGPQIQGYIKHIREVLDFNAGDEQVWELLLEEILGLEHHTSDWNDQLSGYKDREIAFLDDNLLLTPEQASGHEDDLTMEDAAHILANLSSPS